jgi:glycine/D-amino acid oxidase-like deaminating enzyme
MRDYRTTSFWLDDAPGDLTPRGSLPGDVDADVCIVGAGYTGLWTAYYLAKADPKLRIVVLEREIAGFGASGRNGGWCSAFFPASLEKLAAASSRDEAIRMQRTMFDTVEEVGRACAEEGIDAHYHRGGVLGLAITPAQLPAMREEQEYYESWGFGEPDWVWLDAIEARHRLNVTGCLGGRYSPHCARVQPARLARGLAETVEKLGVTVYEQTAVTSIEDGAALTPLGRVKAEVVVRATEAYTVQLPGQQDTLVPIYSLMICTEPLPKDVWDEIGWDGRECFNDGRHLLIYLVRTEDDRIAMGGRGAPYHYASRIEDAYDRVPWVIESHERTLRLLFPAIGEARITHAWGGPLGWPRDLFPSVGYEREQHFAWAGGYAGDGVATANLSGRTLADLITGRESDLTTLPWVGHLSPSWEREPLRWLGINAGFKLMAHADRVESGIGRPARRAALIDRLMGQ